MNPINKQKGVAILLVLFLTALMSMTALGLLWQRKGSIYGKLQLLQQSQAREYLNGLELWGKKKLENKDFTKNNLLPLAMPETAIAEGYLYGTLADYQSRFNINLLEKKEGEQAFAILLEALDSKMSHHAAEQITHRIVIWAQERRKQRSLDDTDANPLFYSVSELRLIPTLTRQHFVALQPYLAALPKDALVNEKSLLPDLQKIWQNARAKKSSPIKGIFSDESQYFVLTGICRQGEIQIPLSVVFYRHQISKELLVDVVSRSYVHI